jgi:hypothetical protein
MIRILYPLEARSESHGHVLRRHAGGNFDGKATEPRLRQRGHRGSSNMFKILKVAFSDF